MAETSISSSDTCSLLRSNDNGSLKLGSSFRFYSNHTITASN